jgi:hypothetical protein
LKDPFFIFYDSRSGSTFLADLLIKYGPIAIPPETNFIPILLDSCAGEVVSDGNLTKWLELTYSDPKFSDWGIDEAEIIEAIRGGFPIDVRGFILLLCEIYKKKFFPESQLFGIKKNYIRHYRLLNEIFPESRFVTIIRDGRAVFNSKKKSIYSVTGRPFETSPIRAARAWVEEMKWTAEIMNHIPSLSFKIRYEDLVEEPEECTRKTLSFLGLEDSEFCSSARGYYVPGRYGKDLHKNVGDKPLTSRSTAWSETLSNEEIYMFERIAADSLLAEGYDLVCPSDKLLMKLKFYFKSISHILP